MNIIQGVPKKRSFVFFFAITPLWILWKGLEIKVGGVLKNSGNSLSDRHKNFEVDFLEAEKIGSIDGNPKIHILNIMWNSCSLSNTNLGY